VELPRLEPIWNRYRDEGFAILAIEANQETEGALKFIEEKGLTYTFVEDVEDEPTVVRDTLGVEGFPTSYIVDRKGRILYRHLGFDEGDEKTIEEEVKRLLES
jgi:peroxiredoxin